MSMSQETDAGNSTFLDKANMRSERFFFRLPLDRINWLTSSFLIGTLALAVTAVPLYFCFSGSIGFRSYCSLLCLPLAALASA